MSALGGGRLGKIEKKNALIFEVGVIVPKRLLFKEIV